MWRVGLRLWIPAALASLALLIPAGGCDRGSPTEPDSGAVGTYLFEVELENHDPRFPPFWLGLVVEADGRVFEYERTGRVPGTCDHRWQWLVVDECAGRTLGETTLAARFAPGRALLTELSAQEVQRRLEQAMGVSDGPYATPNRACNDFGILSLVAFDFDSASGRYTPLVLRLEGDQIRRNLSPGATSLAPWLLELAEEIAFIRLWRRDSVDCRPD